MSKGMTDHCTTAAFGTGTDKVTKKRNNIIMQHTITGEVVGSVSPFLPLTLALKSSNFREIIYISEDYEQNK